MTADDRLLPFALATKPDGTPLIPEMRVPCNACECGACIAANVPPTRPEHGRMAGRCPGERQGVL